MPSAPSFQRWFKAAGAGDPKSWTPTKTLYAAWRTWVKGVGEAPGSVGWFASQMRGAGVAKHRSNAAKGWHFMIPDVDEIRTAIRTATHARRTAHELGDAGAKAAAIRQQLMAKRRAGAILLADQGSPLAAKLSNAVAQDCVALARLSDEQFARKAETIVRRAVAEPSAPQTGGACPRIKMAITPWIRTSDGALTRTLTCIEEDGAVEGRPSPA